MRNSYKCSNCEQAGCRLWRKIVAYTAPDCILCFDCACEFETLKPHEVLSGWHNETAFDRACRIGEHVPAVPADAGASFLGVLDMPLERLSAWTALPIRQSGQMRRKHLI